MSATKRVLILCTGNSCRSQMAEGLVNHLLAGRWEARSAGTRPADRVHPLAVRAMDEAGIDVSAGVPELSINARGATRNNVGWAVRSSATTASDVSRSMSVSVSNSLSSTDGEPVSASTETLPKLVGASSAPISDPY